MGLDYLQRFQIGYLIRVNCFFRMDFASGGRDVNERFELGEMIRVEGEEYDRRKKGQQTSRLISKETKMNCNIAKLIVKLDKENY